MPLSHPTLRSRAWHTPTDKGQDVRSEAETTGTFQGLFLLGSFLRGLEGPVPWKMPTALEIKIHQQGFLHQSKEEQQHKRSHTREQQPSKLCLFLGSGST